MKAPAVLTSLRNLVLNNETRKLLLLRKRLWFLIMIIYSSLSIFSIRKRNPQYSLKFSASRKISKIAGKFAHTFIPRPLRSTLFSMYAKAYGVRLHEIEQPLDSFESFNKFFTRTIKPRPIDQHPLSVASPADSRVLTFSEVKGDEVLIVKGIEYRLGEFLTGIPTYKIKEEELQSMKKNPNNRLYQIILYLAPGDYHRYHAPADCGFRTRNHIVGKLLPVKENYVKTHTNVYEKNERVSLFGEWVKGLMCMVFVGALNVGSIELNFDKELVTNKKLKVPFTNTDVKVYTQEGESSGLKEQDLLISRDGPSPIKVQKGEEIGRFNLGSTIVLVFEASPDFEWKVQPGDKLEYGQLIGLSK